MKNPTLRPGMPLSPRERAVLAAYARHGSTKEAADALGIAPSTVRNRMTDAYTKLGVDNAIAAFRRLGWLVPPFRLTGSSVSGQGSVVPS